MEILIFTLLGLALIIADLLFIPGGIFVALGSVMILYSVFLNFQLNGFWIAALHLAACLAIMPKIIIESMRRISLKKEMRAEDGYVGVEDHQNLIGLNGNAASDLRPSGTVLILVGGREEVFDCIAEGGFIEKGSPVVVSEERGPSLVVRARREMKPSP